MTNQVDQFYVGNVDWHTTSKGLVYFTTTNGLGETLRSDLIDPKMVTSITCTHGADQRIKLRETTITMNQINGTTPIVGEDYQIKIMLSQYHDLSDASVYCKYAVAHAGAKDSFHSMLQKLVKSLCVNFSRETVQYFAFGLGDAEGVEIYDSKGNPTGADINGLPRKVTTATKLVIYELKPNWNLALMPIKQVQFNVYCDTVRYNGEDLVWGTVVTTQSPDRYVVNGYTLADMEYFYMGERGDQYRMFAAPQHRINTKLQIDPTEEYDVINIHYAFVDSLGGVQKSEKDITIVVMEGDGDDVLAAAKSRLGV